MISLHRIISFIRCYNTVFNVQLLCVCVYWVRLESESEIPERELETQRVSQYRVYKTILGRETDCRWCVMKNFHFWNVCRNFISQMGRKSVKNRFFNTFFILLLVSVSNLRFLSPCCAADSTTTRNCCRGQDNVGSVIHGAHVHGNGRHV